MPLSLIVYFSILHTAKTIPKIFCWFSRERSSSIIYKDKLRTSLEYRGKINIKLWSPKHIRLLIEYGPLQRLHRPLGSGVKSQCLLLCLDWWAFDCIAHEQLSLAPVRVDCEKSKCVCVCMRRLRVMSSSRQLSLCTYGGPKLLSHSSSSGIMPLNGWSDYLVQAFTGRWARDLKWGLCHSLCM